MNSNRMWSVGLITAASDVIIVPFDWVTVAKRIGTLVLAVLYCGGIGGITWGSPDDLTKGI